MRKMSGFRSGKTTDLLTHTKGASFSRCLKVYCASMPNFLSLLRTADVLRFRVTAISHIGTDFL